MAGSLLDFSDESMKSWQRMSNVDQKIRERVAAFVDELSSLVRQAAVEVVSDALGAERRVRPTERARTGVRRKGGKRSPEDLAALVSSVKSYVERNPGKGVEQIASELSVSSRDLMLPIRKLLASRELRKRGQKRATRYFAGGGARGARGKRGGRRAKKA